ncbi:uncharacterized protein LOC143452257 [Clavelina lepadiformis]|uniref:Uncharacterized protein n=1 Tax=Clavelina lepadiformis TaxID=159417 RepID=A0ABP0H0N1_CLALP
MQSLERVGTICLVLAAFVTLVAAATFAFLNSIPVSLNTHGRNVMLLAPELYNYNMEILSSKYPINITPAGWVFSVLWPLIYLWNFLSASYMVASLCFKANKSPILRPKPLLPKSFLCGWILTFGSLVGWLFSFDREIFELSATFLLLSTFASYFSLGASYKAIEEDKRYLQERCKAMLHLARIMVHNGLAVLSTWITLASLLNINVAVCYYNTPNSETPISRGNISTQASGNFLLGVSLLLIIVWFMLENFVFEKYCRYTLTIYPTLTFALSGLVLRNWRVPFETTNSVLGCTALAASSLAMVVRTFLVVIRHRKERYE